MLCIITLHYLNSQNSQNELTYYRTVEPIAKLCSKLRTVDPGVEPIAKLHYKLRTVDPGVEPIAKLHYKHCTVDPGVEPIAKLRIVL